MENNTESSKNPEDWERDVMKRFAFEALKEQRQSRRWGIFFKFLVFAYLLFAILIVRLDLQGLNKIDADEITALVNLNGVIAEDAPAAADTVVHGLRKAFEHEKTRGVILRINSPAAVRSSRVTSMTKSIV